MNEEDKIISDIVERDIGNIRNEYKSMTAKERIIQRYKRAVMAHPEGAVVHHGDCSIYATEIQICTCGLHHDLMPLSEEDINELYPKFYEEFEGMNKVCYLMREFELEHLFAECHHCKGKGGTCCNWIGRVKLTLPTPPTQKEIDEIFEKSPWKKSSEE